jgi:Lon protease-like protein
MMVEKIIYLPLLAMPAFILPNGIARLTLFSPLDLKLVSIASQEQGFVILPELENQPSIDKSIVNWGSWVEIIDFDYNSHNQLVIKVQCKSLVNIHGVEEGEFKLKFAHVSLLEHWPQIPTDPQIKALGVLLKTAFKHNEQFDELYLTKRFEDANWVISRWLELLPVDKEDKSIFINKASYKEAKAFIQDVICK